MSYKKGILLVFLTAVISGFSIFINKFGVKGINPYVFTFSKNIVVALLLFSIILAFKEIKALKKLKKSQWLNLALVGLIGGSIPFLLFFKGISIISSANAAFIHKLMFLFVAVLAVAFLKERLNKKFLIAAALLLAGNFLLLKFTWTGIGVGEVLVLIATLFWAGENVLSKHLLQTISPRIVAFGRMFFGSLFIFLFLFASGNIAPLASMGAGHWIWVLVTSVLLFGYVITWYTGLKYVDVSVAASVLLVGSVITALLNLIFLHNMVALVHAIGLAAIASGAIIAVYSKKNYAISTATPRCT
ncbi:MAG: DMT family transporter [Nanoarchaeota archaeon]|nr:DMT family transporter [Nanoarchaeota archaeon]